MNISWTKLSIKHKSMVFASGFLIIFLLHYFYITEGQNQRIADLTTQLQAEKQKLTILQGFSHTHPDPAAYLAELGKKSVMAEAMLPNQPDLAGLLSQVEQATKLCGLQLLEIKPAAPITKTGYREIPVEISIKGTFAQTADLLKKLEDIPRFNSLQHVSMNSRQGILESRLVLIVYSYGVPAGTDGDKQAPTGQTDKK